MGLPREAPPAKLFVAVMRRPGLDPGSIEAALVEVLGAVDSRSPEFAFDHSDYYAPEMGTGLRKCFLSFASLVPQDALPDVKLRTNALEREMAGPEGKRSCNLDPGLLTLSSVILATTKGHAHRVYMGRGIYEEVTLVRRGSAWEPLPWTYPDYRGPVAAAFLESLREIYRVQLLSLPAPHA